MILGLKATRGHRYQLRGRYLWVYTRWHLPIRLTTREEG